MKIFILFILASFSIELQAAACTSPVGVEGMMTYMPGDSEYKYCNNTGTWVSMSSGESLQFNTTCSSAGLISGAQFCNGVKFVNMNSQGATSIACTKENELRYDSATGAMNICIGGLFYGTGYCGSCAGGIVVGSSCSDYKNSTTCFADSNCDWDGTQCIDLATTGGPSNI